MIEREFGKTGRNIPVIGQGTWNFPDKGEDVKTAVRALQEGIELGMTHIDTAEMYGDGRSEEIIGEAIQGLKIDRSKLFIVSKVLPSNSSYKGTLEACERSLKRLKTDYLDCYLLHWRGNVPLSETMKAMEQLVDEGKIRSLGVSNFDVYDLEEAKTCLKKHPMACNQVLYNLYERGIERRLVPYCAKHGISVVAYTPFGQRAVPPSTTREGEALERLAKNHNATERQIILAFVTRNQNVLTIPKAAKSAHVKDNAGALNLTLDQDEIAELDLLFPAPKKDVPLATG